MDYTYQAEELSKILQGTLCHINPDTTVVQLAIDSRKLAPGSIFFCIAGETTDGHLYIEQALANGARLIIANPERIPPELRNQDFPRLEVKDPNQALLALAAHYRQQFHGHVIGVTGSNGKTSTKEIFAGLCRAFDPLAHATAGNFNNHIGVPLTLLAAPLRATAWIIEMGTNHFGEIAALSRVAAPTAGMITNIGESHLEFLESTAGVAREKAALFSGMPKDAPVVIPANIQHRDILTDLAEQHQIRLWTYGLSHECEDVTVDHAAELLENSPLETRFRLFEQTFTVAIGNLLLVNNLVGALTLLHTLKFSIQGLMEAAKSLELSVKGRIQITPIQDWILVDDTYNANPTSLKSVLGSLRKMYPERRFVMVIGMMAELGAQSPRLHHESGRMMAECQPAYLLASGDNDARFYLGGWHDGQGSSKMAFYARNLEAAVAHFQEMVEPGDVVLVKGSRAAQMERFVAEIRAIYGKS